MVGLLFWGVSSFSASYRGWVPAGAHTAYTTGGSSFSCRCSCWWHIRLSHSCLEWDRGTAAAVTIAVVAILVL
jgi:hypothetical protein